MYQLNAVVGGINVLRGSEAGLGHAVTAVLRHDLGMALVTDQLFEELTGAPPEPFKGELSSRQPFYALMSPVFERTLAEWSQHGPIAYVEAEFFGGDGYQSAAVWRDGATAWGPEFDERFNGPREEWPINAALAHLGVTPDSERSARSQGIGAP